MTCRSYRCQNPTIANLIAGKIQDKFAGLVRGDPSIVVAKYGTIGTVVLLGIAGVLLWQEREDGYGYPIFLAGAVFAAATIFTIAIMRGSYTFGKWYDRLKWQVFCKRMYRAVAMLMFAHSRKDELVDQKVLQQELELLVFGKDSRAMRFNLFFNGGKPWSFKYNVKDLRWIIQRQLEARVLEEEVSGTGAAVCRLSDDGKEFAKSCWNEANDDERSVLSDFPGILDGLTQGQIYSIMEQSFDGKEYEKKINEIRAEEEAGGETGNRSAV